MLGPIVLLFKPGSYKLCWIISMYIWVTIMCNMYLILLATMENSTTQGSESKVEK